MPPPKTDPDPCYGGGVSGTGDVDGPANATDNALARFDGTSGKVIQNSGVTLQDDDHMIGPAAISMPQRADALPLVPGQGQFWVQTGDMGEAAPRFTNPDGDSKIMLGSNNLSDIAAPGPARINLGLGSLATKNTVGTSDIDNDAVTFAKLQNIASDRLIGRDDAGSGDASEIRPIGGIEFDGSNGLQTSAFTGDVTKAAGGTALTIANNAVTNAKLRDSTGLSVIGNTGSLSTDPGDIVAGSNHQVLRRSGASIGFGAVNLAQAAAVTGQLPIANGGTGGSTADGALYFLINGATTRVPILTDAVAFLDYSAVSGGKLTIQALFNLINSLTAETAPVAADKLPLYDTSAGQTDAITFGNLMGASKMVVVGYTGSGSTGKTVTLTGINRAHVLEIWRDDNGANTQQRLVPAGSTGTIRDRNFTNAAIHNDKVLNAPATGTAQVFTLNSTDAETNQSGIPYKLIVWGTPT